MSAAYSVVRTVEEVQAAVDTLLTRPEVAVDFETTGKDPARDYPLLLGLDEFIVPTLVVPGWEGLVRPLLESPTVVKIEHNSTFEGGFLLKHGVQQRAVFDTMIAAQLLKAGLSAPRGTFTLGNLLERCLHVEVDKTLQKSFVGRDPITFGEGTPAEWAYLRGDTEHLPRLARWLVERLKAEGLVQIAGIENRFTQVVSMMQTTGAPVDAERYKALIVETEREFVELERQVSTLLTPALLEARQRRFQAMTQDRAAWTVLKQAEASRVQIAVYGTAENPSGTAEQRREFQRQMKVWQDLNPGPPIPRMDDAPILVTSTLQIKTALESLGINVPDTERTTLTMARAEYPEHDDLLEALARLSAVKKTRSNEGPALLTRLDGGRLTSHYQQVKATGRISSAKWSDGGRCPKCWWSNAPTGVNGRGDLIFQDPCAKCGTTPLGTEWGANLQNLTPTFRGFVRPPEGRMFVIADYSQIELRVCAEYILRKAPNASDALVRAFRDGTDPHSETAAWARGVAYDDYVRDYKAASARDEAGETLSEAERDLLGSRKGAKVTNFATVFLISPTALASQIYTSTGDRTRFSPAHIEAAKGFQTAFWATNPTMRPILDAFGDQAIRDGYTETLSGRRRYYPTRGLRIPKHAQAPFRRQAANHPIQGTAADVAKLAATLLYERIREHADGTFLWNAVHDELCLETSIEAAPAWVERTREACLEAFGRFLTKVPGAVSCGEYTTWRH